MEKVEKRNRYLFFWIAFPIGWTILTLLAIFYFDLANGPLIWFIVELIALVIFFLARVLLREKKFWVRLLVWISFIALTVGVVILDVPTVERKSAAYYKNPVKISEPLQLNEGKVKGIYNQDKSVEIYAGIPYATAKRWKEAEQYTWSNVRDGSYFGPRSMQPKSNPVMDTLVDIYSEKGWHPNYNMVPLQNKSEQGLYLNIWRPATGATNLPILVYIHFLLFLMINNVLLLDLHLLVEHLGIQINLFNQIIYH